MLIKKIEVKTIDNKTGKFKESKFYDAPAHVRDMIAGFLYLRNMDMSKVKPQDTIVVTGFFWGWILQDENCLPR